MALIKCPDCTHDISDQAIACPYCGRPIAAAFSRHSEVAANQTAENCTSSGASDHAHPRGAAQPPRGLKAWEAPCPSCGSIIVKVALGCIHCGARFRATTEAPLHNSGAERATARGASPDSSPALPTPRPNQHAALRPSPPRARWGATAWLVLGLACAGLLGLLLLPSTGTRPPATRTGAGGWAPNPNEPWKLTATAEVAWEATNADTTTQVVPAAQAVSPPSVTLPGAVLGGTKAGWAAELGSPSRTRLGYDRFRTGAEVLWDRGTDGAERAWQVEVLFERAQPVGTAREQTARYLPPDTRSVRTYRTLFGQTVEVFHSDLLARMFSADRFTARSAAPGTFFRIAQRANEPTVTRVVIGLGNNP